MSELYLPPQRLQRWTPVLRAAGILPAGSCLSASGTLAARCQPFAPKPPFAASRPAPGPRRISRLPQICGHL